MLLLVVYLKYLKGPDNSFDIKYVAFSTFPISLKPNHVSILETKKTQEKESLGLIKAFSSCSRSLSPPKKKRIIRLRAPVSFPLPKYVLLRNLSGSFNPFPNEPWFLRVCSTSLWKTLWEKEKLLVTSNFSFSHSVSTCLKNFLPFSTKLKLTSANSFNLDEPKICRLGKGEMNLAHEPMGQCVFVFKMPAVGLHSVFQSFMEFVRV